jgi:ribulose-phosphate 3-epimerase
MTEIIPAIMPDDYEDLAQKAGRFKGHAPLAQIDIMDGVFVPSKSWPYTTGGLKQDAHFLALSSQDQGMPYWEDLDYEIDLMIARPERHLNEWISLGASRLIFHIESIEDMDAFWGHDIWKEGARDIGGEKVIEIGLAINPDTDMSTLAPYLTKIDFVQCMGIAKIGYQGQPFDERVLERINAVRVAAPNLPIAVDGGVNFDTAHLLKAAGATRLVSGSVLGRESDLDEAISALKNA